MLPSLRLYPGDDQGLEQLRTGLTALLTTGPGEAVVERLLNGREVPAADLPASILPETLLAQMQRHGLLVRGGRTVRLPLQIRLVEGSVIVTDFYTRRQRAQVDFVDPLWGGPTLNKLLVRGHARSALDLGCGCGVMTIAAAAFCARVVGLDINPRAVDIARFNVALNGIRNVEILGSDMFDAVRGQRFDRIMFNSPTGCELKPRNWLEASETILERFFSDVLSFLEEDGYAHVSLCFMDRRRSRFWTRLDRWLDAQRQLQVIWVERARLDRGLPLFMWQLMGSLRDRADGFDVKAVCRGWMVFRRGAPLALRLPLDYKRLSSQLKDDFGSVIPVLFDSRGHVQAADLERFWTAPEQVVGRCIAAIDSIPWA